MIDCALFEPDIPEALRQTGWLPDRTTGTRPVDAPHRMAQQIGLPFSRQIQIAMPRILSLKSLTPIAAGSTRLVYRHPDDPDLVVKAIRPDPAARRSAAAPGCGSAAAATGRVVPD